MSDSSKDLLNFWEDQMKQSHTSSNYFFRKSPSHYHMMLLIMACHKQNITITVEELKTILVTNLSDNISSIDLSSHKMKNAKVEKYFANLNDEQWTSETKISNGKILIPPFSIVYIKEIK